MTASTDAHNLALDKWQAWVELYAEMHKVAGELLLLCPSDRYAEMLAAVKAVEARAEKEAGMRDVCSVCSDAIRPGSETAVDGRGEPIHAGCEACDCAQGEPHRIADCSREDREVGSDE